MRDEPAAPPKARTSQSECQTASAAEAKRKGRLACRPQHTFALSETREQPKECCRSDSTAFDELTEKDGQGPPAAALPRAIRAEEATSPDQQITAAVVVAAKKSVTDERIVSAAVPAGKQLDAQKEAIKLS